jgi:hypothetical protein
VGGQLGSTNRVALRRSDYGQKTGAEDEIARIGSYAAWFHAQAQPDGDIRLWERIPTMVYIAVYASSFCSCFAYLPWNFSSRQNASGVLQSKLNACKIECVVMR